MPQLDLWKARSGYTLGLEHCSLFHIKDDEWDALVQETLSLFRKYKEAGAATVAIEIGEVTATVATDSLPMLIATMLDLSNEEIPDDYDETDSFYRCLMLDLAEGVEDEQPDSRS